MKMARDRLAELTRICELPQTSKKPVVSAEDHRRNEQINDILYKFDGVRQLIKRIRDNNEQLKNKVAEASSTFQCSTKRYLPYNLEEVRSENMTLCHQIYRFMKDVENDLPEKNDRYIVSRIRRWQYFSTREDFNVAWQEHELILTNYEEKIKKILQNQARLVQTQISEEETESLLANNETPSLFVDNILEETDRARNRLRDLMDRKAELQKIERSLTEVRDMFIRIANLVVEQSPLIQVVAYHAQQATLNIDKGADKLDKARKTKIRNLKRKTKLLFWVIVVLLIVVLLLLFVD